MQTAASPAQLCQPSLRPEPQPSLALQRLLCGITGRAQIPPQQAEGARGRSPESACRNPGFSSFRPVVWFVERGQQGGVTKRHAAPPVVAQVSRRPVVAVTAADVEPG